MRRDFTSKKKWEINGISGFDAKKETEGGADIANEAIYRPSSGGSAAIILR